MTSKHSVFPTPLRAAIRPWGLCPIDRSIEADARVRHASVSRWIYTRSETDLRRALHLIGILACSLLLATGCARNGGTASGSSPYPSGAAGSNAASPAPLASAAATAASPGVSPAATPTPSPNLLAQSNGTIIRTYTPSGESPSAFAASGYAPPSGSSGPWTIVYELPGVATLDAFGAVLPASNPGKDSVDFAVSSTSAVTGFTDLGTLRSTGDDAAKTLPAHAVKARWIRLTLNAAPGDDAFDSVSATGTLAPRPTGAPVAGLFEELSPYANGVFSTKVGSDDWNLRVATLSNGAINGMYCESGKTHTAFPGTLDGRTWNLDSVTTASDGQSNERWIINDEGSVIAGAGEVFSRVRTAPAYCSPRVVGKAANQILVLDQESSTAYYPADNSASFAGYRFVRIGDAMLDDALLAASSTVVFDHLCNASDLDSGQTAALMQWVAAGHKLIIEDADGCSKTDYHFLPYPFKTSNPGASGSAGKRLILVEDDSLGTAESSDATHFLDSKAYIASGNQLGDANTTTSTDPHWCGHLFGTNSLNVNGFMQMYALYGRGLIIYNGFDSDDSGNPVYQKIERLQLDQPIPPALACSQTVMQNFLVEPDREGSFTPGTPSMQHFALEVIANQGWKGAVSLKASGDFHATVLPARVQLQGTTAPVQVTVRIPTNASAVPHVIEITGVDSTGKSASSTITLDAKAVVPKTFKRIRVYGIHFDIDSAVIQPRSEPVIAQIAQILKANPSVRMQVEGHTDSDGGEKHNLPLSQHRAQAVVDDLVRRYGIARSRLVPIGYGQMRPVAPNTSPANKALNRRVELVEL